MLRAIKKLKSPFAATLILIFISIIISDYNFRWKDEKWKYVLYSDPADYYAYLPMVFITHDFDISHSETEQSIKHYIGTAIFFTPFFGAAYLFNSIFHYPADGYSMPFQVAITLG